MMPLLQNQRAKPSSDDNLIPLINIVFLLLIFFMVAGQIKNQTVEGLTLPTTAHLPEAKQQARTLEFTAQQNLFLDQQPVTLAQLSEHLQGDEALTVLLDRSLTASHIQPLLNGLRDLHITQIKLITESGAN